MKLQKAKDRREEMSKIRQVVLNERIKQAQLRAMQNLEEKKEKLRKENSKIAEVQARRTIIQEELRQRILKSLEQAAHRVNQHNKDIVEKARKESSLRIARVKARRTEIEEEDRARALTNIENKIINARTRAEEEIKKKQAKAKCEYRAEKARKRRHLLELDRRTNVLVNIGRRNERAELNLLSRLQRLQKKASHDIDHARYVSTRVRASRLIQRFFRKTILGIDTNEGRLSQMSEKEAAILIQSNSFSHLAVACRRFKSDVKDCCPKDSLRFILSNVSTKGPRRENSFNIFDHLSSIIQKESMLSASKCFLSCFETLLRENSSEILQSERTFLSAFLVAEEPIMVFGPKRDKDKCCQILERTSLKLVTSLQNLADADRDTLPFCMKEVASYLVSYNTLFEYWKNADIEDLVVELKKNAIQSWIAFLTAKEALSYANSKNKESAHGDPFFQYQLKYKSIKKGAASHIKRIRASLDKIMGPEGALMKMRKAKEEALIQIEDEKLLENIKTSLDESFVHKAPPSPNRYQVADERRRYDLQDSEDLEDLNEHVVHEILLADNEELHEKLYGPPEESIVDSVEVFMDMYKSSGSITSDTLNDSCDSYLALTLEKVFFDKILEDWVENNNLSGVKDVLLEMIEKVRKLVPKRTDLHDFLQNQLKTCRKAVDLLNFLIQIAEMMGDSLESSFRAESTLEWLRFAAKYRKKTPKIPFDFDSVERFTVSSMAFLVKKLDLCHADMLNFRLITVTPLIYRNGVIYEQKRFEEKHSLQKLHATTQWIKRIKKSREMKTPEPLEALRNGFVEQLLFASEAVGLPEVFLLDCARIYSIRERTQRLVITSALLLHLCTITKIRIASFSSHSELSKLVHYKDAVVMSLRSNLAYEELYNQVSSAVTDFGLAIRNVPLDDSEKQQLSCSVDSILKGTDPVLSLLDKRIRNIFRNACAFCPQSVVTTAPNSMRTGTLSITPKATMNISPIKTQLGAHVAKDAMKNGFNFVANDLLDVAYDAYKVINHCIRVHEEKVLVPLYAEIQ